MEKEKKTTKEKKLVNIVKKEYPIINLPKRIKSSYFNSLLCETCSDREGC